MIRVVTALFIKETLASAANDAEMVIEESRRMAVEYQERLEAGDGNIWLIYIYDRRRFRSETSDNMDS